MFMLLFCFVCFGFVFFLFSLTEDCVFSHNSNVTLDHSEHIFFSWGGLWIGFEHTGIYLWRVFFSPQVNFPDSCLNLHQQYQHRSNQGDIIPTSEFNHQIISTVLKNIFKTDRLSSFMFVKFSFKMHSQLFQKDNLFSWLSFWFIKICSSLFAPMGAEKRWFTVFLVKQCLLCWAPIALKNMIYTLRELLSFM